MEALSEMTRMKLAEREQAIVKAIYDRMIEVRSVGGSAKWTRNGNVISKTTTNTWIIMMR